MQTYSTQYVLFHETESFSEMEKSSEQNMKSDILAKKSISRYGNLDQLRKSARCVKNYTQMTTKSRNKFLDVWIS